MTTAQVEAALSEQQRELSLGCDAWTSLDTLTMYIYIIYIIYILYIYYIYIYILYILYIYVYVYMYMYMTGTKQVHLDCCSVLSGLHSIPLWL